MSTEITIICDKTDEGTEIMGVLKQSNSDEIVRSPKYFIKSGYDFEDSVVTQAKQILEDVIRKSSASSLT